MDNQPFVNKILKGDCLQLLKQVQDSSVDMVFADPPYNLQLQNHLYRPNQSKVAAVNDEWDKFTCFKEYDKFTETWLNECRRVLKSTGTIWVIGSYHNIFRIGKILQDLDYWILNDIVWIKDNPMPNFRGVRFTNAHETIIWAQRERKAKYTFNHHSMKALNEDLQMRSDWRLPLCTGKERCKLNGVKAHSTQKPENLLYRIILASTNPGELVLDPFFGTGMTGAIAKKLGRNFIGIEQDSKYIQIATDRISKVEPAPGDTLIADNPRLQKRIPFGALLEAGLLRPGQFLFSSNQEEKATILADSHICFGEQVGSIHSIAKIITKNSPANGWKVWFFKKNNGELESIDRLRELIRKETFIGEADEKKTD